MAISMRYYAGFVRCLILVGCAGCSSSVAVEPGDTSSSSSSGAANNNKPLTEACAPNSTLLSARQALEIVACESVLPADAKLTRISTRPGGTTSLTGTATAWQITFESQSDSWLVGVSAAYVQLPDGSPTNGIACVPLDPSGLTDSTVVVADALLRLPQDAEVGSMSISYSSECAPSIFVQEPGVELRFVHPEGSSWLFYGVGGTFRGSCGPCVDFQCEGCEEAGAG